MVELLGVANGKIFPSSKIVNSKPGVSLIVSSLSDLLTETSLLDTFGINVTSPLNTKTFVYNLPFSFISSNYSIGTTRD